MKVKISQALLDHNGETVTVGKDKDAETARLGMYLVEGLLRDLPQDNGGGKGLKLKRWKIAKEISEAMKAKQDYMEISIEDLSMIKVRIDSFMPTVLVGPIFTAIEEA